MPKSRLNPNPSARSRRRSAARAAVPAVAISAIALSGAAPAVAGSYEQVSRATGAQGAAAFTHYAQPLGVTDGGRYALFLDRWRNAPNTPLLLRDIVANTTTKLAQLPAYTQVFNLDKAQATMLLREDNAITLRSTAGAKLRTIATVDPDAYPVNAALSGNGKVVVVNEGDKGIVWYDAATGAVTRKLERSDLKLSGQPISDDGSVIAGEQGTGGFGFYLKGNGEPIDTQWGSIVSGDGSTVVSIGVWNGNDIDVIDTADGSKRTFPAARNDDWPKPIALASDGSTLVTGSNGGPDRPANQLNLATGAWTVFGGAFTGNIRGDLLGPTGRLTAFSPNGKSALLGYGGSFFPAQLAVVNLAGGDLPGDQEPVSASSYVYVEQPTAYNCATGGTDQINGIVERPAAWLPKPLITQVRVAIDGKTALNKITTKPWDRSTTPYPAETDWLKVPFNGATAKKITFSATTLDARGQIATSSETTAPICEG